MQDDIFLAPGGVDDEFSRRFPEQIRTLLAMLRMSRLGGLAVAECDDMELRERLFKYFQNRLADENIYLYTFEVGIQDINLVRSLRDLTDQPRFRNLEMTGKYRAIAIFVYGIEKLTEDQEARFIYLLNFLRDAFNLIEQTVVIWGTSDFVTRLARSAPDFWSWKGMLFSFPSAEVKPEREDENMLARLPPTERYISEVLKDPDYAVWRDLYLPLRAIRADESIKGSRHHRYTLTEEEIDQIREALPTLESFKEGDTVFEHGQTGDKCYIVLQGEVVVTVKDALGNDIMVDRIAEGGFFGEIALIEHTRRTAAVRVTRDATFITVQREDLERLADSHSEIVQILTDASRQRLETRLDDPQGVISPLRRFALEGYSLIRQTPVDVRELTADDRKSVILGEAGAGKTTVLRRIMLDIADEAEGELKDAGAEAVIPIFVKLNALSPERTVEELILDTMRGYGLHQFETQQDVKKLLHLEDPNFRVRGLVFLMDGLNEMLGAEEVRQDLNRFINEYSQQRFFLSCRVQDYVPIALFRAAMLQRLSGDDIVDFLVKYLGTSLGPKVAHEIYGDPQLEDLAQTPLALYMFAQIAKTGRALPKNRGVLFERFCQNLLERTDSEWWKIFGRSRNRVPLAIRRGALATLGRLMQEDEVWSFPRSKWMAVISQEIFLYREGATPEEKEAARAVTPEDVFEEIIYSGLLRYAGDRERVEFSHHTVQEFFASLSLRDHDVNLEPLIRTPDARRRWQGTIVLLYGITSEEERPNLFASILGRGDDYARIWLAAECLANSGTDVVLRAEKLEKAVSGRKQRFAMLFAAGVACRRVGHYHEALTYLHHAVDLQPGNADVQHELGSLYRLVGQYDRAAEHLEEAIRLRPDFVDAYNQLGITYYDQKQYVEAMTVFMTTTHLEPSNAYHFYNLGTVQKILREYDNARDSFHRALELKPNYHEARTQLEILDKALGSGVARVLEGIPVLSKLTLEQSVLLANRLKVYEYEAGQIVFHMGQLGDTFYILEEGEVEVLAPDMHGHQSVLNRLRPGDFFGEIALLRAVPRTATIRCVTRTRLLGLSREDFDEVMKRYPSVATGLAETSGLRLLHDRQRGRRDGRLERYYDPGYIEELAQEHEVTVVMGDIHGSTLLTNAIGPGLMVGFLDEYLMRMSTIIVQSGGAMDRSLGDSVMGVFGSTPRITAHGETNLGARALLAALRMRQAYLDLRNEWMQESGEFRIAGLGVGISTGEVAVGTVGTESAMVGSAVNLANKLSKMAIKGREESEIYIDQRTYELVGESIIVEELDPEYTARKSGGLPFKAYRVIQRR